MSEVEERFKERLAEWLHCGPDRLSLYWKGRVALYSILCAYGIGEGDEVILPAFTCVVVPNAILYTGATPVYVDIDEASLNPSFEAVREAVSERTAAILCQNSFGLSTDLDRIASWAKEKGILTIEDCTHGFGGTYEGRPNGTICDASFFSSQWNKPFSTGLGGFSYIGDDELLARVQETDEHLLDPGLKERTILKLLILARKHLLRSWNYWPALKAYRSLSRMGWVVGSSSGEEVEGVEMPSDYFKGMARFQMREGIKALQGFEAVLARRKENGMAYSETLRALGKWCVAERFFSDHAFLTYPVLVKDREAFRKEAEKARIPLGDWFASPLHPVEGDLRPWGLDRRAYPLADKVSQRVLNLPTDPTDPARIHDFLRANEALLLEGI